MKYITMLYFEDTELRDIENYINEDKVYYLGELLELKEKLNIAKKILYNNIIPNSNKKEIIQKRLRLKYIERLLNKIDYHIVN